MNQKRSDEFDSAVQVQSALDALISTLRGGDFQARWEVSKTLAQSDVAAIEPLLPILEDEDTDWELLWFVARILGNISHPAAVTALVNLLATTTHAEVAGMAATALTHHGAIAIPPLTQLLSNQAARLLAVQALAQIRHADVVPALLSTVTDPTPAVRAAAIEALSHFYQPDIPSVLLAALDDVMPTVRRAAVIGLGIQAPRLDLLELVQHLKPRLWDFNLEVCLQTAIALGRLGSDAAVDALFELLQSPHTPVPLQIETVRALARMETPYALTHLQRSCHLSTVASTPDVQQELLTVLGRVDAPAAKQQASEILLDRLHSSALSPAHRQTIALSLGQLGQLQALDPLVSLLADANPGVRFHAIAALKQLDLERSYERLQEYATNLDLDDALKQGVTIALQEWNR
jgi:HEAT repeat protein